MNVRLLHQELLGEIIQNANQATQHTYLDNYLGNSHLRYAISMPKLRSVGKNWYRTKDVTAKEYFQLITSLIKGKSATEKMMGGLLLDFSPKFLNEINPKIFDQWLNHLVGWAEVDTVCYGHFKVEQFTDNWPAWKNLLPRLNKNKNINKRRASLVLLCKPLTQTTDERLRNLAFKLIDGLKHEKEVLISKAISWILRSMVKLHRKDLTAYIQKNKTSLPPFAVRETWTKLKTGRKNG
ncbi:MAG: DNA alkylation repair protein [Bacteroidetes bacterium]|nr:DNA alkylation repair protein [Bacteroidota bacterium]